VAWRSACAAPLPPEAGDAAGDAPKALGAAAEAAGEAAYGAGAEASGDAAAPDGDAAALSGPNAPAKASASAVRELVCAALRHSAGAEPADAPAGLHDGWLGDALLRPLLLCAVRRARTHAVHRPATLRS